MMYTSLSLVLGARFLAFAIAQNNVISLSPAAQPTSGSSSVIAPSFAGFGIEPSNLYSFTGGENNPNDLSINLLTNLKNYTGFAPHLRIGGNSQDNMQYRPDYQEWTVGINPNPKGVDGWYPTDYWLFGPNYFKALNRFPSNTTFTYGLNMADQIDGFLGRIVETAHAAWTQTHNLDLTSFEIGNEVDLYIEANYRTSTWTGAAYVEQWLQRANAVYGTVLGPNKARVNFFEPGCTASSIGTDFTVDDLVQDGVTKKVNETGESYVSAFNQHDYYYFIGVSTYQLTIADFMDLSTTDSQFAYWITEVRAALEAGYPFALREMGVVGPIGMDGITNVFAASLWTLNFFLYSASLNISSVQMHMTDNSNASAWQPIEYYGNQPHVRPNYYAWAAFDQAIGGSCRARVSRYDYAFINAPGKYNNHISAYSIYHNEQLSSIVIINTAVVNASATVKQSLTVDLTLPAQFAGKQLYLSYLSNDGADSKTGTTWNAISYEMSGDGTPTHVADSVQSITIGNDGSVQVSVRDTQALVAQIGSRVGSNTTVDYSACGVLAAAKSPTVTGEGGSSGSGSNTDTGKPGNAPGLDASDSRHLLAAAVVVNAACLGGFALV